MARTVHHSTNHGCLASALQLGYRRTPCWAQPSSQSTSHIGNDYSKGGVTVTFTTYRFLPSPTKKKAFSPISTLPFTSLWSPTWQELLRKEVGTVRGLMKEHKEECIFYFCDIKSILCLTLDFCNFLMFCSSRISISICESTCVLKTITNIWYDSNINFLGKQVIRSSPKKSAKLKGRQFACEPSITHKGLLGKTVWILYAQQGWSKKQ